MIDQSETSNCETKPKKNLRNKEGKRKKIVCDWIFRRRRRKQKIFKNMNYSENIQQHAGKTKKYEVSFDQLSCRIYGNSPTLHRDFVSAFSLSSRREDFKQRKIGNQICNLRFPDCVRGRVAQVQQSCTFS